MVGTHCATRRDTGNADTSENASLRLQNFQTSRIQRVAIAEKLVTLAHGGARNFKSVNTDLKTTTHAQAAAAMDVSVDAIDRMRVIRRASPSPRGWRLWMVQDNPPKVFW